MKKEFVFMPAVLWGASAGFNLLAAVRSQEPATTYLFLVVGALSLVAAYHSNKYALQSYSSIHKAETELAVLRAILKERMETNEHIREITTKDK